MRVGGVCLYMIVFQISGESQEVSDTKKQLTEEPPIVISDDDDDLEKPAVIDNSCDQDKTAKIEEKDECAVLQHKFSSAAGNQSLQKNLCQLPNDDPKDKLEILDGKLSTNEDPIPVVEQPRKRKNKTKNITVPPGKPIKPSMSVPLTKPSATSVPARLAVPFPPDMSVL